MPLTRVERRADVTNESAGRCIRCNVPFHGEPFLMAGRAYCCAGCSVGSACEHQGVHRGDEVRKYDTMFDRFRRDARVSNPFETNLANEEHASR